MKPYIKPLLTSVAAIATLLSGLTASVPVNILQPRFDAIQVNGSVIPEPSAALLGGLGLLVLLRRRR